MVGIGSEKKGDDVYLFVERTSDLFIIPSSSVLSSVLLCGVHKVVWLSVGVLLAVNFLKRKR